MAPGPVFGLMAAASIRAPWHVRHRAFAIAGTIALGLSAAGCSVLDDVVQHAEDVIVYIGDDEEIFDDQATSDADAPYRTLGEVPDRVPAASSPEEHAAVAAGLVADRDKAQHTSDALRNRHERESDAQSEDDGAAASGSPEEPLGETSAPPRTAPTLAVEPASKAVLDSRDPAVSAWNTPSADAAPKDAGRSPAAAQRTAAAPSIDMITTFKSRFDERFNAPGDIPRTASGSSSPAGERPRAAAPRRADTDDAVASMNRPLRALAAYDSPSIVLRAGTIHFARGSTGLSREDHATLKRIAALRRDHGARVRVVGHASRWTRDMPPPRNKIVNLDVSLARASAVSRALLGHGVPPEALSMTAVAASQPVAVEDMPRNEARNRRVEIFIEY